MPLESPFSPSRPAVCAEGVVRRAGGTVRARCCFGDAGHKGGESGAVAGLDPRLTRRAGGALGPIRALRTLATLAMRYPFGPLATLDAIRP